MKTYDFLKKLQVRHPTIFIAPGIMQEIKTFIMKKALYAVASLVSIAALQSCEKNMDRVSKQIVIDTIIASGTEYVLNLQPYGDQDDLGKYY